MWRWHKTTIQIICAKFTEKQLCWGTFSVFLKLKGCNFIIKEIRRRCCPVTFAKFLKTVTQHLCVAASGVSAILVMLEEPLRRNFLYYVCCTSMTIELKLRSPETNKEKRRLVPKALYSRFV